MKKRKRYLCIALFFVFTCTTFAFAQQISNTTVPQDLGKIVSQYQGTISSPQIVYIQDAHAHYDVQKSIAALITHFCKTVGSANVLVAIEGASTGAIDTSSLSWFDDPHDTEKVCDQLMKEGKVNGADYRHAVMSSHYAKDPQMQKPFLFYGIENKDLYLENRTQYVETLSYRDEQRDLLNELEEKVELLKEKFYSLDLREFEKMKREGTDNKEAIQYYMSELIGFAFKYAINIQKINPEKPVAVIYALYELTYSMGKINFDLVHKQAQRIVKALAGKGVAIGATKDLVLLLKTAHDNDVATNDFLELKKCANFSRIFDKLDYETLIKEKEILERTLREAMLDSDTARKVYEIDVYIKLLQELNGLTLTREREKLLKDTILTLTDVYEFISNHLNESPIYNAPLKQALLESLVERKSFYTTARKRDAVLVENFLTVLEKHKGEVKIGILISGGYHSEGIESQLKEKDISFIAIMPQFENDDAHVSEKYIAGIKNETSAFAKKIINVFSEVTQ
ncbi:MAG: hypothetical protein KKH94_10080 [Candidatus Omnitrophica bacterium]|nr:hypothetical protein [Candidatus Omnitrophota bacterium]